MNLSIKLVGLQELQQKFSQSPNVVSEELNKAMQDSVITLQGEVRGLTPVDTGRLRQSVATDVRSVGGTVIGTVGSVVTYAPFVEFGTRPHFPPIAAVSTWASRHGFGPGGGFLVARAISIRGTKAVEMFQKGLQASRGRIEQFFEAATRRFADRLNK